MKLIGRFNYRLFRPRDGDIGHRRIVAQIHSLQAVVAKSNEQWRELARLQGQLRDFAALRHETTVTNTIMKAARQDVLTNYLDGVDFTQVGPFMGLISSVGYSAIAPTDTMLSHSGWNEAGNGSNYPTWGTPTANARVPLNGGFDAVTSAEPPEKGLTAPATFVIATNGGTLKGPFLVLGTGAAATNNDTGGILFSAALFEEGDQAVIDQDIVSVGWSLTAE